VTHISGIVSAKRTVTTIAKDIRISVADDTEWSIAATSNYSFSVHTGLSRPSLPKFEKGVLQVESGLFACDIRVDNRAEVASLLRFDEDEQSSRSDSELFARAWCRWGEAALDRIVGAFAIAIWDPQARRLTLVRDHAGERPLYFLHQADLLAFSSLTLPLRNVPGVDTSLDEDLMCRRLAVLRGEPTRTLFKSIHKLLPGHLLTFQDGVVKVVRYWHPIHAPATRFKRNEEYVEAFTDLFDQAVSARLETTGRVGSELSGGMDSSSVTATAALLLGDTPLTAFTAVPQQNFNNVTSKGHFGNEGPAAARLAELYPNIEHVFIDNSVGDLVKGMHAQAHWDGYPVFNPLNQMWMNSILSQSRERGITVLLNAECGNSTISATGLIGLSELFRKGQWMRLARLIFTLRQRGYLGFQVAASMAMAPAIPAWLQRKLAPDSRNFSFAFSPLRQDVAGLDKLRQQSLEESFHSRSTVEDYRRQAFEYFDPGPANVASELIWGVESRDPTQDKRIFDFCYSIPIEQFLADGQTRSLVRRSMRGRVPASTLACRDLGLQVADWYLTMGARRQELLNELALIRLSPMANRLLDLDRIEHLLKNWPTSNFDSQEVGYSWHQAVMRGISAGNFIRQYE
jgi:asparagine synthase (glutamine-hydrolysing)